MATSDFHAKLDVDDYYSYLSRGQFSITRFFTAGAIGTTLVGLSGIILTGTVVALIMATPVLVLFSPVLVPAATVMILISGGFVFSGMCGLAAIAALTWLYKYVTNYVSARKRDYIYGGSYAQFGL